MAAAALKRAVEIDPSSSVYRCNLGVTLAQLGNKTGALEQYKVLKEQDPASAQKILDLIYRDKIIDAKPQ